MPGANVQRLLTLDLIAKRRITAPAVWLNETGNLGTNISDWEDENDPRHLGVRLVDGYIELQIKSPDDIWTHRLFDAAKHLSIDARAAFGMNDHPISSILLKIQDPESIDAWAATWPRGFRDKASQWVETAFVYSSLPTVKAKNPIWRESSPLPGSRLKRLVAWRPMGKPAATDVDLGREDLEPRPIGVTTMEAVVRAIAFATLTYWIRAYLDGLPDWDASLVRIIGGWLARLVLEGRDINARGKSLVGVCWAPIATDAEARALIEFLGARGLLDVYTRAAHELERNPVAKVPGWGALEGVLGRDAKISIRRTFRAGLDIDIVERMSEQFILNVSDHLYVDREALLLGVSPYEHKRDDLIARYDNDLVYVGKKTLNPFKLYAGSQLRTDVHRTEFRPGEEPGAILRFSRVHGIVRGEERHSDEYQLLNVYRGFSIKPIGAIDLAIMQEAVSMLDAVLRLITQDNDAQMKWLKKFVAQIAQHPEIKPQVCPIIVGGQGIGKSAFGETLMKALFGEMAGTADAGSLSDNKFLIAPFINVLIAFVDEVRLESVGAINIIKKLVRSDRVSGQMKFGHQRDYYIPARLLIASNSPDIGLTPADAADRAFFFIVAWTAENKRMTDEEFVRWAQSLKPFYAKFIAALESVAFRRHLMRYFVDLEVTREELEDLTHSSKNDESVVRATMSKAREVARAIVADARVVGAMDIKAWFTTANVREAIQRVDGKFTKVDPHQVMTEFERAGVVEKVRGDIHKFKWGYGKLLQMFGDAHHLPITNNWDFKPGDFDDNDVASNLGAAPWRGVGAKNGQSSSSGPRRGDPDWMPDE